MKIEDFGIGMTMILESWLTYSKFGQKDSYSRAFRRSGFNRTPTAADAAKNEYDLRLSRILSLIDLICRALQ